MGSFWGSYYASKAAGFLQEKLFRIENPDLAQFLGFLSILIIFWVLCLLVGSIIARLVRLSGLAFVDRLCGFVFGSAKIFFIFAILVFCISKIDFLNQNLQKYTQGSIALPLLEKTGAFIMNEPSVRAGIENIGAGFDNNLTR